MKKIMHANNLHLDYTHFGVGISLYCKISTLVDAAILYGIIILSMSYDGLLRLVSDVILFLKRKMKIFINIRYTSVIEFSFEGKLVFMFLMFFKILILCYCYIIFFREKDKNAIITNNMKSYCSKISNPIFSQTTSRSKRN